MTKARRAISAWLAGMGVVCLCLSGGPSLAAAKAGANVTLGNAPAATSGGAVSLPVSGAWAGLTVEPSTLVLSAAWDAGWIELTGVSAGPALAASGKSVDFEPHGKSVKVVIYGGSGALPQGDLVYLNFQISASAMVGASTVIRDAGTNASDAAGEPVPLNVANGGLTVTIGPKPHSADYSGDWRISLSELLRVVQFYNIGSFHCDASSEDGYAPGLGDQGCTPHDSDYSSRNWVISLNELLRIIQFYNASGGNYHYSPGTEDNYAPGPWAPIP